MFPVLQVGDRRLIPEAIMQLLGEYQMLPQLVKELVIDDAIAQIKCNQEEEKIAIAQISQQYQLDSEAKRQMWLQQNNLTSEQLDAIAIRQLKLEKFKQTNWGEDLETYFRQRKPQLDRVIYSLLRTNDMALAQELYFRISEGEDSFARLAQEYSQGLEVETDGLIGPVELQSIHPVMVKVLSNIQPQQLVPPTQVGDWVVLIRLEKLLPAKLDNSMRQRLLNERFQVWLQTQMQEQKWQVMTPEIEVLQPLSISYS
ncbi:peptidylprolyl isomerase [Calothrix sp. UHCC 0171]|uniref:peptidylprolyl isomerase n=1 Tax=Calothrix sp. UHCC 0171 TaxID=3110245 RepID=UPI002B2080B3|nr:peptidylprolyl isomerase [Calothrix sp. UHCC 0171]MEA5572290.1 peptidylprolyl isomerase [Calothrix sp. UHCC 0171]